MPFKNGKYFDTILVQSVDNAISSANKLSKVCIAYFRHSPSASRIVSQNCFSMVNKGINKPYCAFSTITRNELLYFNQIFASFP